MKTRTVKVWLCRRRVPLKNGKIATYWTLKWHGSGLTPKGNQKLVSESLGSCTQAEAEEMRRAKIVELSTGAVPIDPCEPMPLATFRDFYLQRRARRGGDDSHTKRRHKKFPKLSGDTLKEHDITLRYLIEHFGPGQMIDTIGPLDADAWLDALEDDKLVKARSEKCRRHYARLSEQTVRGHVRNAKAMFNWARAFEIVTVNPFDDFEGTPLDSEPNHHVSLDDFEKVVAAASSDRWRAMFGLCRLAGLRTGAALTLPWAGQATDSHGKRHWIGVDWDRRRICVVGKHKRTRRYREVPVCQRLLDILLAAFENAKDGQVTVTGFSGNNVVRDGNRIVRVAGLEPWPKLYQAMRSSCENDWKSAGYAEPTYCAWAGHSPTVSRKHYVAPTDAEFDAVTNAA